MTGCPEPERLARAALSRIGEARDLALRAVVDAVGPVEVWARLRAGASAISGIDLAAVAERARSAEPSRDLDRLEQLGGRLVCPGEAEWPDRLDALGAAPEAPDGRVPYALWVRGRLQLASAVARSVAVVGSRAATAYGSLVAAELAAGLAERGCTVVSGGAYGIDGAVHRGALAAGGRTAVVLAGGIDVPYPRGHDQLFERVAGCGVLVSESPPGAAAMRHRFLSRNRLIAALGLGTVIVEAAPRSGALSTARHADRLCRPLMAIPGPVTSTMSAGCHALVRAGQALLVTGADDVLDVVGVLGVDAAVPVRGAAQPRDSLSAQCQRVLDAVPVRRAAPTARIAVTSGLDPPTTTARLAELAAAGMVEPVDGGWRLAEGAGTC